MANILVVEDDPTIRELVRLHLASANHDVITAADGLLGLQLAVSKLPDIIISDVQMPNMDGFGMLAAVRANEQTAAFGVRRGTFRPRWRFRTPAPNRGASELRSLFSTMTAGFWVWQAGETRSFR